MSGVPTISYSTLSVVYDSIPVWGSCHKRIGNNVILKDDTGGLTCYKCFNLVLRSDNVLQIHTAGLDKCYTTEDRAVADCPSDMMIRERRAREIMLYRKLILIFYGIFYSLTLQVHVPLKQLMPVFRCKLSKLNWPFLSSRNILVAYYSER